MRKCVIKHNGKNGNRSQTINIRTIVLCFRFNINYISGGGTSAISALKRKTSQTEADSEL